MYLNHYKSLLERTDLGKELVVETFVVPDGEENKSMAVLNTILDKCLQSSLDRQATLVALGGGVIGDMVGFAAAIYLRGISFIQVPTTVMAMVDSSVGGKTGINHPLGKNMIGSFHQPACVFIDTNILQTLPNREYYSGIAEIIKYGLIRDASFFEWLESEMDRLVNRDASTIRYAVTRSCQNKAAVVKLDERENSGARATLNLGHTFGHAIENGSGYGTWLHGEAVSIGTMMAIVMCTKQGWITEDFRDRIQDLLERAHLPIALPNDSPMTKETFMQLMSVDKKVSNGQLRLILLRGALGNCVFTADYDQTALVETIDEFVEVCSTG
jgi:3-dehydroquinate synthase